MDFRLSVPSLSKAMKRVALFFRERQGKILLTLSLASLPLLFVSVYWMQAFSNLFDAREELSVVCIRAAKSDSDKRQWDSYMQAYANPDPYYFEESVETLTFLEGEKEKLTALLEAAMFSNHDELQKRYRYITSGENALRFSEDVVLSTKKWKESVLTQLKPIEIEEKDLVTILQKVEGRGRNKPQCIITSCVIENDGGINFTMECLKRELFKR